MIEQLCKKAPLPCVIRGLLERCFSAKKLDELFTRHAKDQYTKTILFSTICDLMLQVVLRIQPSAHAAYQARQESMGVSAAALYDKLKGIEPSVAAALVRENAKELIEIQDAIEFTPTPQLPGYHTRILDGNCIAASEKRLKVLRNQSSAPLPGKSLVILDPDRRLIVGVVPCEDGHAQERSLLDQIIPIIEKGQLWIADRNFCTTGFLNGVFQQGGFVLFRQHGSLPFKELSALSEITTNDEGQKIQEQDVDIEGRQYRRIRVELITPTRDGDTYLYLITDILKEISAVTLAALYRKRWSIETAFQQLEAHLASEINTLAYPRAALFCFCLSLLAYNAFSMVMCTLDCVHQAPVSETLSTYYMGHEVASTFLALFIFSKAEDWRKIGQYPLPKFSQWLLEAATNVNLKKYKKHPRGPKKLKEKVPFDPKNPHVSTAQLIKNSRKQKTATRTP